MSNDGLYWFQYKSGSSFVRESITVTNGQMYKMDGLDGTWDDISGGLPITAGNHCDFETFLGNVFVTNGVNPPWMYNGTGNAQAVAPFVANSYTFSITPYTIAPSIGAIYQDSAFTNYTVVARDAGNLVVTGALAPATAAGTLTRIFGAGDPTITYSGYVVNANIQSAKYVALYNNYLFFANVTVGGTYYPTRIYWSDINNTYSWSAANWIEVAKNDGQEITGIRVLADRLVIYKTQSIYCLFFTGDADVPFTLPGGGKTNSHVGCIAPFSIQEIDNSHIFLAYDGIYIFDGNSSNKISYKIDKTFLVDAVRGKMPEAVSLTYKTKNRYLLAISLNGVGNDTIVQWDYYNNAFSLYDGWNASSMATFLVGGYDERPYFGDYLGYVYRTDIGYSDYPANIETAINGYYYTNWKAYDDLVNQKGTLSVYVYYTINQGTMNLSWGFDFTASNPFSLQWQMGGSGALWGSATWSAFSWAKGGGQIKRVDTDGRGRVVRYQFANNNIGETFQIDGFGSWTNLETME